MSCGECANRSRSFPCSSRKHLALGTVQPMRRRVSTRTPAGPRTLIHGLAPASLADCARRDLSSMPYGRTPSQISRAHALAGSVVCEKAGSRRPPAFASAIIMLSVIEWPLPVQPAASATILLARLKQVPEAPTTDTP